MQERVFLRKKILLTYHDWLEVGNEETKPTSLFRERTSNSMFLCIFKRLTLFCRIS
jgi:hypothetical protein